MTGTRRGLFAISVALSSVLLLSGWYASHLRGIHGKEWTMERVPSVVLPLSYPLALLAIGLAFTGRGWYRIACIAAGLFALLCWIDAGVAP
ncbi:hypothetical protein [Terriglobus sp.]|uniref:hypothetical protein n=1 Tax=Terriglobus sp. TaxID=1889013 RepID=UPI003B002369